jgi:hypothetical protein
LSSTLIIVHRWAAEVSNHQEAEHLSAAAGRAAEEVWSRLLHRPHPLAAAEAEEEEGWNKVYGDLIARRMNFQEKSIGCPLICNCGPINI